MYRLYMGIQILSAEVIDQIAAGEVLERPAHMIKELVENSIDAGATELEIEFEQGGKYVKISDNGKGMSRHDLTLCLQRHATSKITKATDIWELSSFGFRGEALASISSVSEIRITTRQKGVDQAYEIYSQFGKVAEVESLSADFGTTIIINNLFQNVPARLKFLKSDVAETTQIKNVLKAMAMSHPEVQMRVRNKGKLLFFWEGKDVLKDRVLQVLGQKKMYAGDFLYDGFKAEVVLSSPNNTMGNSKQIWIFVQNRWVQDKTLQAALMDAYRSLLMHGEFPIAVVKLYGPKDEVDVNIHPTKSQVKFVQSNQAFRAVNRAARGVLEKAPWLKEMLPQTSLSLNSTFAESTSAVNENVAAPSYAPEPAETISFAGSEFESVQFAQKQEPSKVEANSANYTPTMSHGFVQRPVEPFQIESLQHLQVSVDPVPVNNVEGFTDEVGSAHWSNLQVLGQGNLTYILTQSETGLVIVDQHAAHERVLYERLRQHWDKGGVTIQNMLIPLSVDLDEEQTEAVLTLKDDLSRLGVVIEQLGPSTIGITAAPEQIKEKSLVKSIQLLAREMVDKGGSFAVDKYIGDVCATMACHSAIRAGQALSHEQMRSLLQQMDEFPMSSFCPHGRPVFVEYDFTELEKDFGRIV